MWLHICFISCHWATGDNREVQKSNMDVRSAQRHSPFSQLVLRKEAPTFLTHRSQKCVCWLITLLRWLTTQQLAALRPAVVRKQIIYYQCLSGATLGLRKKPGCESEGRTMPSAAADTSRQKEATTAVPPLAHPAPISVPVHWIHNYSFTDFHRSDFIFKWNSLNAYIYAPLGREQSERGCGTFRGQTALTWSQTMGQS